jgi:hypothetical protein
MMMNVYTSPKTRLLISSAAIVAALMLSAVTAIAQPAGGPPGGGPGGPGGAPGGATAGPEDPMIPNLPANAPQPTSDPRDFSGVWYHVDSLDFQIKAEPYDENRSIPFNDLGKQVIDRRVKSLADHTPYVNASALCYPPGPSWQMDLNMPFNIVQTKDWMEWLFEEFHGYWLIQMAPKDVSTMPKTYMGNSVAHWDGDTLVVETSGFKQATWVDVVGTPASADAKITQRIRKVKTDHWFLEVESTINDPTFYTRPWTWIRAYDWRPDMVMFREYNCEEQMGDPGNDPMAAASVIREPKDAASFEVPLMERNVKAK